MWALAEFRAREEINFSKRMSQIIIAKSLNSKYQVNSGWKGNKDWLE